MFFDYKKAVFFSVFLLFSSFAFGQIAGDFRPAQGPLAKPIPAAGSLDRVKVVEVFSFTCPHCHRLNKVWSSFYEKFKDKIDSHHYEIGWAGPNPGKFYYLANSLEKGQRSRDIVFSAFHDSSIRNINHPQVLEFFSKDLKIGKEFKAEFNSPKWLKMQQERQNYIRQFGVSSTPTFIVEDSIIASGDLDNLAEIVNSLLKEPVR